MEPLNIEGDCSQIGDVRAEDLLPLVGKPGLTIETPDGRKVIVVGLTREEARGCVSCFMESARLTIGTAEH